MALIASAQTSVDVYSLEVDNTTIEGAGTVASPLKAKDGGITPTQMSAGTADTLIGYDATGAVVEVTGGTNVTITGNAINATGTAGVADGVTIDGDGAVGTEYGIVDGGVGTTQIADDAVTLDKIGHSTADTLMGYDSAGIPTEVSLTGNVTLSAGVLNVPTGTATITTSEGVQGDGAAGTPAKLDVDGLTQITVLDTVNDFLVVYDATDSTHKKVAPVNLPSSQFNRSLIASATNAAVGFYVEWVGTTAPSLTGTDGAFVMTEPAGTFISRISFHITDSNNHLQVGGEFVLQFITSDGVSNQSEATHRTANVSFKWVTNNETYGMEQADGLGSVRVQQELVTVTNESVITITDTVAFGSIGIKFDLLF